MIEYLACGNVMSDEVIQPDGYTSERHMGGPAFFALSGIRLWTKNVKLVSQVGADFKDTYGKWMKLNGVTDESVRVVSENCSCYVLSYNPDGSSRGAKSIFGEEALGYMKTHPEHIEQAATTDVKGIYMAHGSDRVVWRELERIKKKFDYKMMWELEYFATGTDLPRVREAVKIPEMWSLNYNEASKMFGIPRENDEDIINELMKMTNELTFYRVGKRGAFAVTPSQAYFCGSVDVFDYVDQTGCGNCSTGAAMYAHTSGHTPQMTVAMANIAAAYNCAQYGPFMEYTDSVMKNALKQAEQLSKTVTALTKTLGTKETV